MQWVLHRVVALSGAAEASEEDLYSDDESSSDYEGEWKENIKGSEDWRRSSSVRRKAVLAPNQYVLLCIGYGK